MDASNKDKGPTSKDDSGAEEKKVVLETMLEVEEQVLDKLEKSKFPHSAHESAQRTEIIIAKKMKVDVIKDRIDEIEGE
jgi:hypothetical protein